VTVVRAAALVASGYLVKARHPWRSGKLARYARELGIVIPSDALLLRIPPPWSKVRDYLAAASDYQLQAMLAFGEVAHETAGQPLDARIRTIVSRLKGKTYGRKPKISAPNLEKVKRMLEARRVAGVPTATAGKAMAEVVV